MSRLSDSLEQLTPVLNALADGITVQDPAGKLVFANEHALRLIGFPSMEALLSASPEDRIGRFEIRDESGDPLPLSQLPGRLTASGVQAGEITIQYRIKATGEEYWAAVSAGPLYNAAGDVEYVVNTFRDVTVKKQAEIALRHHTEFVETINEVSQALVAELDLRRLVQAVTDAATRLCKAEFGAFFYNLIDDQGESYSLYTLSGAPLEAFSKFPMPRNTHIFAPTFTGERVVRSDDITQDPNYGKNPPFNGMPQGHLPVRSYLAVPVISKSEDVLGGLFFGHAQVGMFTAREERLIVGLAAQAAIAIDNAKLYTQAYQERERLHVTLSSIGDGVIATDHQSRINFMNLVAQSLTGWGENEARGLPLEQVFRIVNEDTHITVENPVARVLRDGTIVGLANHTVLIARDGREIPIDDSGAPIRGTDGEIVGTVLVFRDVSEARKSQSAIQSAKAEAVNTANNLRIALEAGGMGTWHLDLKTGLTERSLEHAQIFGYSELQPGWGYQTFLQHVHPEDREMVEATVETGRETGNFVYECRIRRAITGGEGWIHVRGQVIYDEAHVPVSMVGIVMDITERKVAEVEREELLRLEREARQRAEKADQLKLKFLAMISHELRTPLTSIKGFTSTLLAEDVTWDVDSQREFLSIMDEEADKLTDLIEQLLDLSLLQAGNLRIHPERQHLKSIIDQALPELIILAAHHELITQVDDSLPEIEADGLRIAQVICNLVHNAAKYSPQDSPITLTAYHTDGLMRIDVDDQGEGIPLQDRDMVFEAFRQVERRSQVVGAGLGLAICKGVIEAHGGSIWIEDKPNPGTLMSFTLPVYAPPTGS